jgi:hypothetical protein
MMVGPTRRRGTVWQKRGIEARLARTPAVFEFAVDTPGGTFSSQNLPARLTLNPVSEAVQGVPGNPGTSTIAVAYTAPSGVTTVERVTLTVLGPLPPARNRPALAWSGWTPKAAEPGNGSTESYGSLDLALTIR